MAIDDRFRDEKFQNSINREEAKMAALLFRKLINMNILQVKKLYLLIKEE